MAEGQDRGVGRAVGLGCGIVGLSIAGFCGVGSVMGGLFAIWDESSSVSYPVYAERSEREPAWLREERESSAGPTGPLLPPAPFVPRTHRFSAHVDALTGEGAPIAVGARCAIDVEPRERARGVVWCHATVRCEERLLYGGEGQGFFSCTFGPGTPGSIVGSDGDTTASDQDAAFELDTIDAQARVRDDASGALGAEYDLRLVLDSHSSD